MKRLIVIIFFLVIICVYINDKEKILIPDNAIRFRVIANSNLKEDQDLKIKIKDKVESELYKLLKNVNNTSEARNIITNNIDKVDNILDDYNVSYNISYGNNYFPQKNYKGITYDAGKYESLVITLGEGLGENWWCVLFPPLCLLDESENLNNKDYKIYATKLINIFKEN